MPRVSRSSGTKGKWLDKDILENGDYLKITTEADWIPSKQGSDQLVAKCRVKGKTAEDVNFAINTPSRNALIDAFGDDTSSWVGKVLGVKVEPVRVAGKSGIALYLIPEGFEFGDNAEGYAEIRRLGGDPIEKNAIEYPEEDEINPEDIPF